MTGMKSHVDFGTARGCFIIIWACGKTLKKTEYNSWLLYIVYVITGLKHQILVLGLHVCFRTATSDSRDINDGKSGTFKRIGSFEQFVSENRFNTILYVSTSSCDIPAWPTKPHRKVVYDKPPPPFFNWSIGFYCNLSCPSVAAIYYNGVLVPR